MSKNLIITDRETGEEFFIEDYSEEKYEIHLDNKNDDEVVLLTDENIQNVFGLSEQEIQDRLFEYDRNNILNEATSIDNTLHMNVLKAWNGLNRGSVDLETAIMALYIEMINGKNIKDLILAYRDCDEKRVITYSSPNDDTYRKLGMLEMMKHDVIMTTDEEKILSEIYNDDEDDDYDE